VLLGATSDGDRAPRPATGKTQARGGEATRSAERNCRASSLADAANCPLVNVSPIAGVKLFDRLMVSVPPRLTPFKTASWQYCEPEAVPLMATLSVPFEFCVLLSVTVSTPGFVVESHTVTIPLEVTALASVPLPSNARRCARSLWRKWLNRRTRGRWLTWERFEEILRKHPLLRPRIQRAWASAGRPV
jgi:hypothetical protein